MTKEQQVLFNALSAIEKAERLKKIGWVPSGDGDGLLGELEWWVPLWCISKFHDYTCPFDRAVELTLTYFEGA